jgi:alanine-glyoxylate transaminase/serine-glyoxylate transaminase/serine-pyruvate transaminase
MNEAMILGCLAGVEAALQVQGVAYRRGGVDAAIASLVAAAG